MNRTLAALPLFALSLSATPLPFTATELQADADIVGQDFAWRIISDDGVFRTVVCPIGVPCEIKVDRFNADSSGDVVSVHGTYHGQSYGFSPFGPLVVGELYITATATFGSDVTTGQIFTVPSNFFARIQSTGLDLRFQGSGSSPFFVVRSPGSDSVQVDLAGTSVFSGFVEQVPEPAAWQLAGIGLLFPAWRRIRRP